MFSARERKALKALQDERRSQDEKWGIRVGLDSRVWLTVLSEEVGEAAREILEQDRSRLREEVTQVAAVALAWLEDLQEWELGDPRCPECDNGTLLARCEHCGAVVEQRGKQ